MLWPLHGRSYAAEGIFGQYVFVDPDKNLVVAMWSAQSKPLYCAGLNEYRFLQALSDFFLNRFSVVLSVVLRVKRDLYRHPLS
jgi:CubicO group peptidase (beta-lactamase class C family)